MTGAARRTNRLRTPTRGAHRRARSPATHASAARLRAKLMLVHWTYGHSSAGRSRISPPAWLASWASDHTVLWSDGYHWFQATVPSNVGHVVLPTSMVFANGVKCPWLSHPVKNRPLTIS